MSFLLPLALLVGLFAVFPLLAHALRRGQAKPLPFPATRLVPSRTTSARQRHRIEDKLLLLLRILLILCLALLAASPFVKCSRLSLSRTDGASVAAALVIDDSASMRARTSDGSTRLEAAIRGATQLLGTARSGDSFSIVLAGYPARVLTSTTTELSSVKESLTTIQPSDRRTDLQAALELARSLQRDAPQSDRPIVLLSDLSVADANSLDLAGVVLPEAGLREPMKNCALVSAMRSPEAVQAEIACTGENALAGRKVQLFDAQGEPVGPPVDAGDGAVRIPAPKHLEKKKPVKLAHEVRLSPSEAGADDIESDDRCAVIDNSTALTVGLRADQGKAGLKTGAGTVLQAAIEALDRGVRVHALSLLPEDPQELEPFGALVVDDPSGFVPEVRDALSSWTQRGGVAVVFLGPGISQTPLGSDFTPFLNSSPSWSKTDSDGTDPKKPGALGPLSATWNELGVRSRAQIQEDDGQVLARWDDGAPLVAQRSLGRGLLVSVALPSSVDESDLALRPAFLELLDYVISEAAIRKGAQATLVGERWSVEPSVTVRGPEGDIIEKHSFGFETPDSAPRAELDYVEPPVAGVYRLEHPGSLGGSSNVSTRIAIRDLKEHVSQPSDALVQAGAKRQASTLAQVGISREIALLTLILGAIELAFRVLSRSRRGSLLQQGVS